MNSGPYLILHKVRGEPAFDIAERLDDETWIIPTIGHRAYPWRWWLLEELSDISDINSFGYHNTPSNFIDKLPVDWRDHYVAAERRKQRAMIIIDSLTAFGDFTTEELTEALAAVRGQPKESA